MTQTTGATYYDPALSAQAALHDIISTIGLSALLFIFFCSAFLQLLYISNAVRVARFGLSSSGFAELPYDKRISRVRPADVGSYFVVVINDDAGALETS